VGEGKEKKNVSQGEDRLLSLLDHYSTIRGILIRGRKKKI